jgi:hypothetical protein
MTFDLLPALSSRTPVRGGRRNRMARRAAQCELAERALRDFLEEHEAAAA